MGRGDESPKAPTTLQLLPVMPDPWKMPYKVGNLTGNTQCEDGMGQGETDVNNPHTYAYVFIMG